MYLYIRPFVINKNKSKVTIETSITFDYVRFPLTLYREGLLSRDNYSSLKYSYDKCSSSCLEYVNNSLEIGEWSMRMVKELQKIDK